MHVEFTDVDVFPLTNLADINADVPVFLHMPEQLCAAGETIGTATMAVESAVVFPGMS